MIERRLKIISVTRDLIVDVFRMGSVAPSEFISLPVMPELPEGCEVVSVDFNFSRYCFDAIIFHESFDEVPNGCCIPRIESDGYVVYRRIQRLDAGYQRADSEEMAATVN